MPLKLEIRDRAIIDIEKIALYIAKRNRDAFVAERFARRLLDKFAELVDAPGMGSVYLERRAIRRINEGSYMILYQITDSKVIVLRIWDGRRDADHEPCSNQHPSCAQRRERYSTPNNGEPQRLRGLPRYVRANDPTNLIRVMPAEGGAEHGFCGLTVRRANPSSVTIW